MSNLPVYDEFDAPPLDTSKWPQVTRPELLSFDGGSLLMGHGGLDYGGATSIISPTFDMTNNRVDVLRWPKAPSGGANIEHGVSIDDNQGRFVSTFAVNNTGSALICRNFDGSSTPQVVVSSTSAYPWWSIAHEGNEIIWRHSTDGLTWEEGRRVADVPLTLESCRIRLFAYYWGSPASPSEERQVGFGKINVATIPSGSPEQESGWFVWDGSEKRPLTLRGQWIDNGISLVNLK